MHKKIFELEFGGNTIVTKGQQFIDDILKQVRQQPIRQKTYKNCLKKLRQINKQMQHNALFDYSNMHAH